MAEQHTHTANQQLHAAPAVGGKCIGGHEVANNNLACRPGLREFVERVRSWAHMIIDRKAPAQPFWIPWSSITDDWPPLERALMRSGREFDAKGIRDELARIGGEVAKYEDPDLNAPDVAILSNPDASRAWIAHRQEVLNERAQTGEYWEAVVRMAIAAGELVDWIEEVVSSEPPPTLDPEAAQAPVAATAMPQAEPAKSGRDTGGDDAIQRADDIAYNHIIAIQQIHRAAARGWQAEDPLTESGELSADDPLGGLIADLYDFPPPNPSIDAELTRLYPLNADTSFCDIHANSAHEAARYAALLVCSQAFGMYGQRAMELKPHTNWQRASEWLTDNTDWVESLSGLMVKIDRESAMLRARLHGTAPVGNVEAQAQPEAATAAVKPEAAAAGPKATDGKVLSKEAKALAALADHPDWTNGQIAQAAGCHVKSLSRMRKVKMARKEMASGRDELPRGRKRGKNEEGGGDVEAWDDDR